MIDITVRTGDMFTMYDRLPENDQDLLTGAKLIQFVNEVDGLLTFGIVSFLAISFMKMPIESFEKGMELGLIKVASREKNQDFINFAKEMRDLMNA